MGLERMHRGLDDSRRNCIHAHTIFGALYRERFCRGVQGTLGERCKHSRHAGHRLVDQGGRESQGMTNSLLVHDLVSALVPWKESRGMCCLIVGAILTPVAANRRRRET